MEEIYKPNTDGPEKVEVYSRENNDMLGDMPEWLIHTGSYIVYGLIVFLYYWCDKNRVSLEVIK